MVSSLWPTGTAASPLLFTGRQLRQTIGALWGALTGKPLGARSGIVAGTPATIVSITGLAYTIGPHKGVLCLASNAAAGPYVYAIDDARTASANAADQTNPRADLISVTMTDASEGDGTTSGPTFTYTPGTTTNAVAQLPATPDKSMPFARIDVPRSGNGSPTITLIAPFVVAAGGILPVRNAADFPAQPYVGQYIDDPTYGLRRWNGSVWAPIRPISGSATAPGGTANAPSSVDITFPAGMFSVPPVVHATPTSNAPATKVSGATASNISTTGATLNVTRTDSGTVPMFWTATDRS